VYANARQDPRDVVDPGLEPAIRGKFPQFRQTASDTVCEIAQCRPAGPAQAVVMNRPADRVKFESKPRQQAQERRLHHRDDLSNPAAQTHHRHGLDQTEAE
jgi:hypothetical protein